MATFFDGKLSFKDVDINIETDNGINTSKFLEAAEGVVQLFGKDFFLFFFFLSFFSRYFESQNSRADVPGVRRYPRVEGFLGGEE